MYMRSNKPLGQSQLDQRLSQSCNILSVTEFCHAMDLTYEGLSDTERPSSDSPRLVHLAALLLSEHPAILRLIRRQCSDRPASLRTQDIGSIWSLLSKFLIKSKHHDQQTSTIVFQEITMVIGALVRFRRDLVALTLPHLSMALQQLLMSIRSPRPQLGAKQHTLVTDTLPLGTEEGKALARLLETLITKTTIRTHSSTAEVQRAESLARPFSKHAAYIIKAYIDTMNDPLCILPSDLRKELRPGLFALCNMINDHSRDAMMVSGLDAGGKTIMKSLWTEYEKQKYVGKG
ncbi:Urb2/Npa2 family-domain-containing protein [Mycena sp. CBHHK59/15]|nr:Urb2/Npa2 family-domain-containing protein [Mycena sp. CBHHK59/15]